MSYLRDNELLNSIFGMPALLVSNQTNERPFLLDLSIVRTSVSNLKRSSQLDSLVRIRLPPRFEFLQPLSENWKVERDAQVVLVAKLGGIHLMSSSMCRGIWSYRLIENGWSSSS